MTNANEELHQAFIAQRTIAADERPPSTSAGARRQRARRAALRATSASKTAEPTDVPAIIATAPTVRKPQAEVMPSNQTNNTYILESSTIASEFDTHRRNALAEMGRLEAEIASIRHRAETEIEARAARSRDLQRIVEGADAALAVMTERNTPHFVERTPENGGEPS